MASPNLSEIVTTTLRSRTGKLADNVSKNTALLNRLREKGKKKPVSGGSQILQELEYAENGTFQYYSGYETLNIAPSDVLTSATFDFKQASVAVAMSGLEEIQNAGPERIIDLLEARIQNAEKTMINNISVGIYSDGTGSGGKQIGGLQLLISTAPSGTTVGGINAGTWSFWQNIAYSGVTNGGAAVSAANIQQYMTAVWVQLVRNTDKPDIIVADNNYWTFYQGSLVAIQRIVDTKTAESGFQNIMFMTAPVVLDGGFGGAAPSNTMYFCNTDYLFYRPSRSRDMFVPEDDRVPINQDAIVKMILWAGNMTVSNRRLQGVLYA
jgi:hypothetical protein